MDTMFGGHGWGIWGMWLIAGFTVAVIVWAVRDASGRSGQGLDPRRILDERLAGGEIDRDEYLDRLALLQRR
jgi:uncharacterized membrane protein